MLKNVILSLAVIALGVVAGRFILTNTMDAASSADPTGHGGGDHPAPAEPGEARGPNGGRLLMHDGFSVELAIFERGVPPEFRAWFTRSNQPVAPADVRLQVQLRRPGGVLDEHAFEPQSEFALGQSEVYEPHSFDYVVEAEYAGRTYQWKFSAPEMQTAISAESAGRAGVEVETARPATIPEALVVYGEIKPNSDHIARAVPRFAGVVREARKALGDTVTAGDVVAVVESNETLVSFEVKAPISGTIVERNAMAGESVVEAHTLYVIADLSEVWVDLAIPRSEQNRVRIGQRVDLYAEDDGEPAQAQVSALLPTGARGSQSLVARVALPDDDGRWRPGWFVKGEIVIAGHAVPVAVEELALQTVFDFTVVFSQHGELYQARPLELGRRGGGYVEVLKGLLPGESYVTENSFLIKADVLKSGATHDH